MKFLLAFIVLMGLAVSSGVAAGNTCVASAPNGNSLRVYDAPTTNGPVIGGIGVGTCGINVTNQCEGTMCVVALPGLNGWVDMRHISNSPVQAPGLGAEQADLGNYVYAVTGGSGTVTAAGITQPTPVDATGTVSLRKSSPTAATLTLPREVTDAPIGLTGRDAGPWSGGFGSWGGMPMNVGVTFTGLGNQTAQLVLQGTNQIASMKITLALRAQSVPSAQSSGTNAAGSPASQGQAAAPADPAFNACTELDRITKIINAQAGTRQIQDMRSIYVLAGVKSTEATADQAACRKALDLIAQDEGLWKLAENGLGAGSGGSKAAAVPVPSPNPGPSQAARPAPQAPAAQAGGTPNAAPGGQPANERLLEEACIILQPQISPLLRGQSRADRDAVLRVLAAQGVVSVASAQPRQCAFIMAELIAVGLIVNDNRPWVTIAQGVPLASGAGGEDPAAMIAGGAEIGIHPSDFIPEFDPAGQQAASAGPAAPGAGVATANASTFQPGDPCLALGDAMIVTIRLGFAADLDAFAAILKKHRVETLAPSSAQICASALNDARQAGLAR
ncbi:hypothetical protein [uncultured Roseibium sp.]|uniref:hypothetical protein n=1 Tax=uncultured Roseibium sp. TaxID=1936171 RepID=UPI0026308E77|nr:hypothetical protein [uncultured Roseibium sp.]